MTDADIDYSDIPPLGKEFFAKVTTAWPPVKQQLTIRLDADVLTWLKATAEVTRPALTTFCEPPWTASRSAVPVLRQHRRKFREGAAIAR
jgi:hypothetical protein